MHLTLCLILSLLALVEGLEQASVPGTMSAGGQPPILLTEEQMDNYTALFQALNPEGRANLCKQEYRDIDEAIQRNLEPWLESGISLELMNETTWTNSMEGRNVGRAVLYGFRQGKAVIVQNISDRAMPGLQDIHFGGLHARYMPALLDLEQLFGPTLPDVDFLLSPDDTPLWDLREPRNTSQPVFHYCKTNRTSDILIPIFHSYQITHKYTQLLRQAAASNARYPWEGRTPKAFWRGAPYGTTSWCKDGQAYKHGAGGTTICHPCHRGTMTICYARQAFAVWSLSHAEHVDAMGPHVPMPEHAQFKYLVHLDGIAMSSRLEQQLPLGSVVFRQSTGYESHLTVYMKAYEHYIPFWKRVPEEIVGLIDWARDHDEEARRIALQGQILAQRYLSRVARACHWYLLLSKYASLLRYDVANNSLLAALHPGEGRQPLRLDRFVEGFRSSPGWGFYGEFQP